jgi:hypothetical protein
MLLVRQNMIEGSCQLVTGYFVMWYAKVMWFVHWSYLPFSNLTLSIYVQFNTYGLGVCVHLKKWPSLSNNILLCQAIICILLATFQLSNNTVLKLILVVCYMQWWSFEFGKTLYFIRLCYWAFQFIYFYLISTEN